MDNASINEVMALLYLCLYKNGTVLFTQDDIGILDELAEDYDIGVTASNGIDKGCIELVKTKDKDD